MSHGPIDASQLIHTGPTPVRNGISQEALPKEGVVAVIVKVSTPYHVPTGAEVRAWMGDRIFTANIPVDLVDTVQKDPGVVSMALAERIGLIEPR
jgi:hypothetical protein